MFPSHFSQKKKKQSQNCKNFIPRFHVYKLRKFLLIKNIKYINIKNVQSII